MVDRLSRQRRSWNMSRIRGRDTKPEVAVRSLFHRAGFRFRLHRKDLPGRPDVVLAKWGVAVFVHGCFWHRHPGCRFAYTPKSNRAFWSRKFIDNMERDKQNQRALRKSGWKVLVVWECQVARSALALRRITKA
jgi:DNA mismatch endonuclease (patch repair protein)